MHNMILEGSFRGSNYKTEKHSKTFPTTTGIDPVTPANFQGGHLTPKFCSTLDGSCQGCSSFFGIHLTAEIVLKLLYWEW